MVAVSQRAVFDCSTVFQCARADRHSEVGFHGGFCNRVDRLRPIGRRHFPSLSGYDGGPLKRLLTLILIIIASGGLATAAQILLTTRGVVTQSDFGAVSVGSTFTGTMVFEANLTGGAPSLVVIRAGDVVTGLIGSYSFSISGPFDSSTADGGFYWGIDPSQTSPEEFFGIHAHSGITSNLPGFNGASLAFFVMQIQGSPGMIATTGSSKLGLVGMPTSLNPALLGVPGLVDPGVFVVRSGSQYIHARIDSAGASAIVPEPGFGKLIGLGCYFGWLLCKRKGRIHQAATS